MDLKQIGMTIRKLRISKGLTQLALAKIFNVSDKTISKWESGKGLPEIESLINLSDYFQISIDDLLRGKLSSNEHTEFLYIMDASGSMYNVTDDVIGGFNSFIDEQQLQNDRAFLTTVIFNHTVSTLYESRDVSLVQKIDRLSYRAIGSTALFDAIGQSVIKLENRANTHKVLVTIMTDGYENSSRYFTRSKIKRMIETKTSEGWEFIFAGANIDVDKVGEDIGIKKSQRLKFTSDSAGTRKIYTRLSDISTRYRQTGKVDIKDEK
jgi:transcriptional regulator with XRE-family HTH domain